MKINIKDIDISTGNPRTFFSENALKELSESIKEVGLITPISVIQKGKRFELIAGERRLRACIMLNHKTIKADVIEATDEKIKQIKYVENIQRAGMHPMEEAMYIDFLFKDGNDIKAIAKKISKNETYIKQRYILLNLIDEIKKLFLDDLISIVYAIEISRLNKNQQKKVFDKLFYVVNDKEKHLTMTIKQLNNYISNNLTKKLKEAPFDLVELLDVNEMNEKIVSQNCLNCNQRTGNNNQLFFDILDKDVCFNSICYDEKIKIHCQKLEKKYKENGFDVVRLSNSLFAKEYHNVNKYQVIIKEINGKFTSGQSEVLIGIFFDHTTKSQIGKVVGLLKNKVSIEQNKAIIKNGIYPIREKKAKKAYFNTVLCQMAQMIGERPTELIQLDTVRYLGLIVFKNVNQECKDNITLNYKWKLKAETFSEEYFLNTQNYSFAKLCELMLFTLSYGGLNSDLGPIYEQLLFNMARNWGIDLDEIKNEINNSFNVKL